MSRANIRSLDDKHITATEKRGILATIEFLRGEDPKTWGTMWVGYKRSPKSYSVLPDPEKPGRYSVAIKFNYRTDLGQRREQIIARLVQIDGIEPLPLPAYQTQDLFAPKPWETEQ